MVLLSLPDDVFPVKGIVPKIFLMVLGTTRGIWNTDVRCFILAPFVAQQTF